MFGLFEKPKTLVDKKDALKGRDVPLLHDIHHYVLKRPLQSDYPKGARQIQFGMGCFWGAERIFWQHADIWISAVGYSGGHTPNPTYEEVCSGKTGHTEAVLVVYEPETISLETLLALFWEGHDPTQGMRQGNDIGTQYRSAIYTNNEADLELILKSRDAYAQALATKDMGAITTEIKSDQTFYFAEDYHQQYLAKNPNGYCGLGGTGVSCPVL